MIVKAQINPIIWILIKTIDLFIIIVHNPLLKLLSVNKYMLINIFMLWCIKNGMVINWPHYIMQHMMKCRDNNMPLPYAILITQIM